MAGEKYDDAIEYFERANEETPNQPLILNNLAWTYLVCDEPDPERSLELVDSAIGQLTKIADMDRRNELASHFFDTRGKALLRLNRLPDAIDSFERALAIRPENIEILESLVECLEGEDSEMADAYRKRLDDLILNDDGS